MAAVAMPAPVAVLIVAVRINPDVAAAGDLHVPRACATATAAPSAGDVRPKPSAGDRSIRVPCDVDVGAGEGDVGRR